MIPFCGKPSSEHNVQRLAFIARLLGFESASPQAASVLEIGCGSGTNIITQALMFPSAQFLGVDCDSDALSLAQKDVEHLGLKNIRFECADVCSWDPGDVSYDYILCFGMLSWVSPELQEKLVKLAASFLSPNGLACLSYNCMPGWEVRKSLRSLIRQFDRKDQSTEERIELVKSFLRNWTPGTYSELSFALARMKDEIKNILSQSDQYLFWEFLGEYNQAFYLEEVARLGENHGLYLVGDAKPQRMRVFQDLLRHPKLSQRELVLLEQEKEIKSAFPFRESIFTKNNNEIHLSLDAIKQCFFASHLVGEKQSDGSWYWFNSAGTAFVFNVPEIDALLQALSGSWPESKSWQELSLACSIGENDEHLKYLLHLWQDGLLDCYLEPLHCSNNLIDKPCIHPYACVQARQQDWVVNYRQEYVELDNNERQVAQCCDGTASLEEIALRLGLEQGLVREVGRKFVDGALVSKGKMA